MAQSSQNITCHAVGQGGGSSPIKWWLQSHGRDGRVLSKQGTCGKLWSFSGAPVVLMESSCPLGIQQLPQVPDHSPGTGVPAPDRQEWLVSPPGQGISPWADRILGVIPDNPWHPRGRDGPSGWMVLLLPREHFQD